MGPIKDFRDLEVWQLGMDLVERVLRVAPHLPPEERFGLGSQLRNASVSVPSNIAEGYGRGTRLDYVRFLRIERVQYLPPQEIARLLDLLDRNRAMLHELIASLDR